MAKDLMVSGEDPIKDAVLSISKLKELTESYKIDRADTFAGVQAKIIVIAEKLLISIKKTDITEMDVKDKLTGIKNLVAAATTLFEKERLERDLSTENVSVLVMAIRELKKKDNLTSSA